MRIKVVINIVVAPVAEARLQVSAWQRGIPALQHIGKVDNSGCPSGLVAPLSRGSSGQRSEAAEGM